MEEVALQPIVDHSTHHDKTPIQNYHTVGSVEPPRDGGVEGEFYDIPSLPGNASVEALMGNVELFPLTPPMTSQSQQEDLIEETIVISSDGEDSDWMDNIELQTLSQSQNVVINLI